MDPTRRGHDPPRRDRDHRSRSGDVQADRRRDIRALSHSRLRRSPLGHLVAADRSDDPGCPRGHQQRMAAGVRGRLPPLPAPGRPRRRGRHPREPLPRGRLRLRAVDGGAWQPLRRPPRTRFAPSSEERPEETATRLAEADATEEEEPHDVSRPRRRRPRGDPHVDQQSPARRYLAPLRRLEERLRKAGLTVSRP